MLLPGGGLGSWERDLLASGPEERTPLPPTGSVWSISAEPLPDEPLPLPRLRAGSACPASLVAVFGEPPASLLTGGSEWPPAVPVLEVLPPLLSEAGSACPPLPVPSLAGRPGIEPVSWPVCLP